jgi:tetratricopeptide (TPR) repeat protein
MRPVPKRNDLLALRRVADDATRLRLNPLTGEAVTDLVAALAGGRPDGDLLAQCRMQAGLFAESLATLDRALASPGLSARHRARLLVLTARTQSSLGDVDAGSRAAASALAMAEEAGDNWAMGWALHTLTVVAMMRGHMTDALLLFDRALAVTKTDPALTDLRLLLQINKVAALGNLDKYEHAFNVALQTRDLASQVGTTIRVAQAHDVLSQLFFETGHWDDALAELEIMPEYLKEPGVACLELALAAVMRFHRGEAAAARRHLADAISHAERIGHRLIGPLALARSLDREHADALPEALAALTATFGVGTEHAEGSEDLLADAVRLAARTGDLGTAQALAGRAAGLAAGSQIPHRQANALYCRGLLDHDANRLLAAAARYQDASKPLLSAMALEAAAEEFIHVGDRGQARSAFTRAVEVYTSLGAAYDVARIRATFRAHKMYIRYTV